MIVFIFGFGLSRLINHGPQCIFAVVDLFKNMWVIILELLGFLLVFHVISESLVIMEIKISIDSTCIQYKSNLFPINFNSDIENYPSTQFIDKFQMFLATNLTFYKPLNCILLTNTPKFRLNYFLMSINNMTNVFRSIHILMISLLTLN